MPLDSAPAKIAGPQEKDPRVDLMVRRWDELDSDRSQHKIDWMDIQRLMSTLPFRANSGNKKMTNKVLASSPALYKKALTSTMWSTMMNPGNKWFGMQIGDPDRRKLHAVKLWQDRVSAVVLASFGPNVSSFYPSSLQVIADCVGIGNAANYDEVVPHERKFLDVTIPMAEIVFSIDAWGQVVEVVRKFSWKAKQAAGEFGLENLPEKIREAVDKNSNDDFIFYHHVQKNTNFKGGYLGAKGKRWISTYGTEIGRAVVRESGYMEMPFHTPRLDVETGQTYGTGFGHVALPNSRVLNRMKDANLRSAQFAASPTLLAPDKDGWPLNGQRRPDGVLYGGMVNGRRQVDVLDTTRGTGLSLEMQQKEAQEIAEIFMYTLSSMVGRTGVSTMESMERQEQYARLMAPYMGRIQEEYLVRKISRRFNMLWRAGQIPPPPPEAEGQQLDVKYLSAASMAQKATEGVAALRVVNDLTPLAQVKPRLLDRINEDELAELLLEARGAPATILHSRDEADQMAAQRAQAEQAQQAMQMAKDGTGMMKDIAQAQQAAGQP